MLIIPVVTLPLLSLVCNPRLAKEMEKKISADESSVENISISNRPMTIADEYVMMQSNEWLGAKRLLDDACPNTLELQKLTLLCDMLDVSCVIFFL